MALFQFKWLRRFVRRHTNYIPEDRAEYWKKRLSLAYALIAWNAFGYVCYLFYTGRGDWAKDHGLKTSEELNLTPGQQFAARLNIDRAKIVRVKGFQKVSEIEYETTPKEVDAENTPTEVDAENEVNNFNNVNIEME